MRYGINRLWNKEPAKCNNQYYYGGEYSIGTADAAGDIKKMTERIIRHIGEQRYSVLQEGNTDIII